MNGGCSPRTEKTDRSRATADPPIPSLCQRCKNARQFIIDSTLWRHAPASDQRRASVAGRWPDVDQTRGHRVLSTCRVHVALDARMDLGWWTYIHGAYTIHQKMDQNKSALISPKQITLREMGRGSRENTRTYTSEPYFVKYAANLPLHGSMWLVYHINVGNFIGFVCSYINLYIPKCSCTLYTCTCIMGLLNKLIWKKCTFSRNFSCFVLI